MARSFSAPPVVARDGARASQLTPGWPYQVEQPDGPYVNRANPTGQWNTMVVEFDPGTTDKADPKKLSNPAWLKVTLNGQQVFKGAIPANGTGSRGRLVPPLESGSIFLQGHWGSQVEYKNPVLEAVAIQRSS